VEIFKYTANLYSVVHVTVLKSNGSVNEHTDDLYIKTNMPKTEATNDV